jgi:hypothetical protein
MFLKTRFAALAAVIAALAVPVASATAATGPVTDPGLGLSGCANWYAGPTTLGTGCTLWMGAASSPSPDSGLGSPRCPDGYSGPTNLATGCPWWLIS